MCGLKGKPFMNEKFIKETFLSCANILLNGMSNKEVILSRIRKIAVSASFVERRITDLTENVTSKRTSGLKQAYVFSIAMDESTDLNLSCLAITARYNKTN